MKKIFSCVCFVLISSYFMPLSLTAAVPGGGSTITELSDDFEDPSWSFDYYHNISSNGMWYGSFRGAPEILQRTTPPLGGVTGQNGALQIRSTDNGDGNPQQRDLVTKHHNALYGRYLTIDDQPSFIAHIYMPAYSSMDNDWAILGFRVEARSKDLNQGYYYPSIWLQYSNNNFGINVRMGDGQSSDQNVKNMGANYPGGWVKLGISFDSNGIGHYYFKEGVSAFTENDKIYDTTMFPNGSSAKMDWIAYYFFSIGYSADGYMSPDYRIGDVAAFFISFEPENCQEVIDGGYGLKADLNNDCVVDVKDFAIMAEQWLKSEADFIHQYFCLYPCPHPRRPSC